MDYLRYLRELRADGYADAAGGEPDQSGHLRSSVERLQYYKGWEDWQEENRPGYKRWTPVEEIDDPAVQG